MLALGGGLSRRLPYICLIADLRENFLLCFPLKTVGRHNAAGGSQGGQSTVSDDVYFLVFVEILLD